MHILCTKKDLLTGVQIVERAAITKNTLPIISNILLETGKNNLTLTGFDLEIGIKFTLDASIKQEGKILVPAKTFSGIISKLDEGEVVLSLEGKGNLKISNRKSIFNIHGIPVDEYPQFPEIKQAKSFSISTKTLREIFKQTSMAVSEDETKQVLNGIFLDIHNFVLKAVATDGYRLALRVLTLENKFDGTEQVIIPARAVQEISKILQLAEAEQVTFVFDKQKNHLALKMGKIYFVTRMIKGQFPDYQQVVPKNSAVKIVVNRKELVGAADRAGIIAARSANIVHLELVDDQLHITANTPDVGTCSELIPVAVEAKLGEAVSFNVRLLLDALRIIDEDEVQLELTGKLTPGIVKPKNGSDYTYVIMPIRTDNV